MIYIVPNIPSDYFPSFKKNSEKDFILFFENFNISENNIISVELAQVLRYPPLLISNPKP
jgi:hypothetical protein